MRSIIKVILERVMFTELENQCGFYPTKAFGWRAIWKELPQFRVRPGRGKGVGSVSF